MKNLGILMVAFFMVATSAFGQKKSVQLTPEQRATKQTTLLTKQLSLTADQATKINKAILDRIVGIDQIKTKYQGQKSKERNAEIREMRISYLQVMKNVLDGPQFDTWHKSYKNKIGKPAKKNVKIQSKAVAEDEVENFF